MDLKRERGRRRGILTSRSTFLCGKQVLQIIVRCYTPPRRGILVFTSRDDVDVEILTLTSIAELVV